MPLSHRERACTNYTSTLHSHVRQRKIIGRNPVDVYNSGRYYYYLLRLLGVRRARA